MTKPTTDEGKTEDKTEDKINAKIDELEYDLIPNIIAICQKLTFQQADELMDQTGDWADPFVVRCTDKSWKKTTISDLSDEVGLNKRISCYTVRFAGGPRGRTLFETYLPHFIADRVVQAIQLWNGDCDDILELLVAYWADNNGMLTDAN